MILECVRCLTFSRTYPIATDDLCMRQIWMEWYGIELLLLLISIPLYLLNFPYSKEKERYTITKTKTNVFIICILNLLFNTITPAPFRTGFKVQANILTKTVRTNKTKIELQDMSNENIPHNFMNENKHKWSEWSEWMHTVCTCMRVLFCYCCTDKHTQRRLLWLCCSSVNFFKKSFLYSFIRSFLFPMLSRSLILSYDVCCYLVNWQYFNRVYVLFFFYIFNFVLFFFFLFDC